MAISKEQSRYTLNGALFETVHGELTIVGTDGHRLAIQKNPCEDAPNGKTIVSMDAIAWLLKRIGKHDVAVTMGNEVNTFYVPDIQTTFISKKLTGNFPNYEAVMPSRNAVKLTATFPAADEFSKLLTKVAQMADERSGAVRFALNGACVLSADGSSPARRALRSPQSSAMMTIPRRS